MRGYTRARCATGPLGDSIAGVSTYYKVQSLMHLRAGPQSLINRSLDHHYQTQNLIIDIATEVLRFLDRGRDSFSGNMNVLTLFGTSAGIEGSVDSGSVTQNLANIAVEVEGLKLGSVCEDPMGRMVVTVRNHWNVKLRDSFFCGQHVPHRDSDGCF